MMLALQNVARVKSARERSQSFNPAQKKFAYLNCAAVKNELSIHESPKSAPEKFANVKSQRRKVLMLKSAPKKLHPWKSHLTKPFPAKFAPRNSQQTNFASLIARLLKITWLKSSRKNEARLPPSPSIYFL